MKTFYITTAIDYPNALPHIGTAFEKIGADVQARFQRMMGRRVYFLMGNDENTVKVYKRAVELGEDPRDYINTMASEFKRVWKNLNISFDDFIQTTEHRHIEGVKTFIAQVSANSPDSFYKKEYEGNYCEGCEEFKAGEECESHPGPLKKLKEENWFFRLTAYREYLTELIEQPGFICPETRRNEVRNQLENLQDVSITRQRLPWGIPFPLEEEHRIYVWFDALLNYITGANYLDLSSGFGEMWPADIHFVGKDITRFHCLLWPAMLKAADLPAPKRVFAHGFIYNRGLKESKSGESTDPMDLADRYGRDSYRYYFMAKCPFGSDGDFSESHLCETHNSDLANNLGNLVSRVATMTKKYFDGTLPPINEILFYLGEDRLEEYKTLMEDCRYDVVLKNLWEVLDSLNRFVDEKKPWAIEDKVELNKVLRYLIEGLRVVSILIRPFMPETSYRISTLFASPGEEFESISNPLRQRESIRMSDKDFNESNKIKPLFERMSLS